jgi:hypothetical protein
VYFAAISVPAEKAGLVTTIPEIEPWAEIRAVRVTNEVIIPVPRQFIRE